MLRSYKSCARARDLAWELTDEDFDGLTSRECFYCGCPPSAVRKPDGLYDGGEFTYNGIDRRDNSLGYMIGNVVPCCWTCNHAKGNMPFDEFMAWVARLTAHHWFNPDLLSSRLLKEAIGA